MKHIYLVLLILSLLVSRYTIYGLRHETKSLEMEIDLILYPDGHGKAPAVKPKPSPKEIPPAKEKPSSPPSKRHYDPNSVA